MGIGIAHTIYVLFTFASSWVALHHQHQELPVGTFVAQALPEKAQQSQAFPATCDTEGLYDQIAEGNWTVKEASRLQDPCEDPPLEASSHNAAMDMLMRLSQSTKSGVVWRLPILLWTCGMANIPQITIQEHPRQGQGHQEEGPRWQGHHILRPSGDHPAPLDQDNAKQKAGTSGTRGSGSDQGNSSDLFNLDRCSGIWRDGGASSHGGTVQGQAPSGFYCCNRTNRKILGDSKFYRTEAHSRSFEQSESSKIGIPEGPRQSCALRCTVANLCQSSEGELCQSKREIRSTTKRSCGNCSSQKDQVGGSSEGTAKSHTEWSRDPRGTIAGRQHGGRCHTALGGNNRPREWDPRSCGCGLGHHGTEWTSDETIWWPTNRFPTRQNEKNGDLDEKEEQAHYEPHAPFERLAAEDVFVVTSLMIGLLCHALFHYGFQKRDWALFVPFGWQSSFRFNGNLCTSRSWAFATTIVAQWIQFFSYDDRNYLADVIFIVLAGTGYIFKFVSGIFTYILEILNGITPRLCDLPEEIAYVSLSIGILAGMLLLLNVGYRLLLFGGRKLRKFPAGHRQGHTHQLNGIRCNARGRLPASKLWKTTLGTLLLIAGGEATHIHNHSIQMYGILQAKAIDCSIGEPYRPPEWMDSDDLQPEPPEPQMVVFMNFARFEEERTDLQSSASSTEETAAQINMVMYGHDGRPVGGRDAALRTLSNEAIKDAVRHTWQDYPFANFHIFTVRPVPDRLRGQGWITIVDIQTPGRTGRPGVLTLKETHVYRRSPAFLSELQQFEAFKFRTPSTSTGLIDQADLSERCDVRRHGSCTVLKGGQVLLLGINHGILGGDHICFLVDEAHPAPPDVIHFANPQGFVQTIQTNLYGAGIRQYLTILLHGFRNGYTGTRIYGAHRQRIEDLQIFAGDIMSIWAEEHFDTVEVHAVHPQLLRRDSDGAINLHFIVFFSSSNRPTVVLHRPTEEGYGDYDVVELPPMVSFARIVDASPWHIRHPAGHYGDRPLQPADLLEVEHAAFLSIEGPDIPDDGLGLIQLHMTSRRKMVQWHAKDKIHGRTVGSNGFMQLRPPGNGHEKRVSFDTDIHFVENERQYVRQATNNSFAEAFADSLSETECRGGSRAQRIHHRNANFDGFNPQGVLWRQWIHRLFSHRVWQ